ncbi:MAG TPA: class I SAM-dependent methyltransferase [Burkholderiales bacterium]|nr:class I SAM-dependent methyltransferase [Burkholderiales bacterium]
MQDWADGYVVDVGYTHSYFRELSPALLRFVALLGGLDIPRPARHVYLELGCGNGLSTALHAAADPDGEYYGVDFNPTHIQHARQLAQDAGVGNVKFLEKSFAELLAEQLPPADFVTLHGVWSWVGEEQRGHLLEVMRRMLKPGGLVYLSYNAQPGLAQVAPLQRLLVEAAELAAGERLDKAARARQFALQLQKAGARYFAVNPLAAARLAGLEKLDPHYVVHEYFNANWRPDYHADVVQALAPAKLAYAGSATLLDNFDQFMLVPEAAKLVAGIPDRALAETMKDFARNQGFRRDVFTRGAPKAAPPQLEAALGRSRFSLARPRAACRLTATTPAGEAKLDERAYAPVLEALARAPQTFDELARAPECAALDRPHLRQAVFGMAAFGNIVPALAADGDDARRARTARFNDAVLRAPMPARGDTFLASPVTGMGAALTLVDRLFLAGPRDEAQAVAQASAWIGAHGVRIQKSGQPLESPAEVDTHLRERARQFFAETLPYLRLLKIAG